MNQIELNGFDLAIFMVYMFAAVGVGFLVSMGRKKSTRGYFLGGKSLPWYVIACSMIAADVSSEHFIANAGVGYTYGIVPATGSWNCWIIYTIFIWVFLPYYVRTNLYTIPEFLERRYSPACRYIFSASLVAGYVGAVIAGSLFAGGLAFERMLGPFLTGSGLAHGCSPGCTPIWASLRRRSWPASFFSPSSPAPTRFTAGCARRRGPTSCRSSSWESGACSSPSSGFERRAVSSTLVQQYPQKFQVFLPVTHERFPFTGVFTGFLTVGIWYTCTSQHIVQRVLAAKDEWHARMGVIGAGFLHIVTPFFFTLPGIIAFKLLGPHVGARTPPT